MGKSKEAIFRSAIAPPDFLSTQQVPCRVKKAGIEILRSRSRSSNEHDLDGFEKKVNQQSQLYSRGFS
jgi:hypothetical protein